MLQVQTLEGNGSHMFYRPNNGLIMQLVEGSTEVNYNFVILSSR